MTFLYIAAEEVQFSKEVERKRQGEGMAESLGKRESFVTEL